MAILPEDIPTGKVTGQFYFVNEDTIEDPDQYPQLTVVTGFVRFKASIKVLRMSARKAVVIPLTFDAKFNSEGKLVPADHLDSPEGIYLPATDSTEFDTTGWTWVATFEIKDAVTGHTIQIDPITFQVPVGSELDLSTIVPAPASPGVITTRGPQGIQGPKGDKGDKGDIGPSPTDPLVAGYLSDPESESRSALSAAIVNAPSIGSRPDWATANATYDNRLDTYNLRPDNLPKWRVALTKAEAGLGQAHITTFLDSITHGANTATSNPKYINSWPGRLARQLKVKLGDGGTGIVTPWDSMPNTAGSPPHDDRLTFAGDVTNVPYGIYNRGAKRVTGSDGAANYIEFTATCDEFWVYSITSVSGAFPRVQVDGGAIQTIAGTALQTTPDYPPQPGYWGTVAGTGNGQIVSRIPVTLGQHTIRLMAPSTSGSLTLLGVEGRIAGKGVRVSNLAQSSRSMADMMLDDTAHHMSGLSVALDMPKSDLSVMLLGMNDYQGHSSTFKSRVSAAIDRQRDGGTYGAHGDVILVTCPQPNYAAPIPSDGILTPPLADYYNDLYELADEKDVPLIDVARRWRNFETSNALGFFGDSLHPNDLGSEDIARAVYNALMSV